MPCSLPRPDRRARLLFQAWQADLVPSRAASAPVIAGRRSRSIAARCTCCFLAVAEERLGKDRIRRGHDLQGFEESDRGVRATFIDKASGAVVDVAEAAMLVGADGIHSAVRSSFHPNEGAPLWNGNILWRGVTQWPKFLSGQ